MKTRQVYAVFAIVVSVAFANLPSVNAALCGDVDDSGDVTVTDGVRVLRAAAGLPENLTCANGVSASPAVPILKDSNGRIFGQLSDEATVFYALGKIPLAINFNNQNGDLGGDLFFTSSDCRGQPLLTGGLIVPHGAVRNATLYYPSGTPSSQQIQSWERGRGEGCQRHEVSAFVATSLSIDISIFVPPFHAEIP